MPQLRVASLQNNSLTGLLPAEWATEGVMTHLEEMYLQVLLQYCGGTLPVSCPTFLTAAQPQPRAALLLLLQFSLAGLRCRTTS